MPRFHSVGTQDQPIPCRCWMPELLDAVPGEFRETGDVCKLDEIVCFPRMRLMGIALLRSFEIFALLEELER